MSKLTGLGAAIAVDDASGTPQTISNDVSEFTIETPHAAIVVTGVDKSATERILGLTDASVSLKGTFNPAANMSHAVLSTVPSTQVNRTTKITPTSLTNPFIAMELLYTAYTVNRSAEGQLTWEAPGSLADGSVPTWTNS